MATWHRQPTGEGEGKDSGSDTGAIRWVAAGPLTTKEALEDANFPIARNDPHPDYGEDGPLRCRSVRIDATGFRVMTVTAQFEIPPDGGLFGETPDESNPLVYSWQTVQQSVPVDRDIHGNAILSSAYRSVEGITRTKNAKRLTITRWETSYDAATALAWENRANSGAFEGAAEQEVLLETIQPSGTYTSLSSLLPVDYTFLFKDSVIWGSHPHQVWVVDKDSVAYAALDAGDTPVRIVTFDGTPVSDVLLDGQGRPKNSAEYTYLDPVLGTPVASPAWSAGPPPAGSTAAVQGDAVFLRWDNVPTKDFAGLGF